MKPFFLVRLTYHGIKSEKEIHRKMTGVSMVPSGCAVSPDNRDADDCVLFERVQATAGQRERRHEWMWSEGAMPEQLYRRSHQPHRDHRLGGVPCS